MHCQANNSKQQTYLSLRALFTLPVEDAAVRCPELRKIVLGRIPPECGSSLHLFGFGFFSRSDDIFYPSKSLG